MTEGPAGLVANRARSSQFSQTGFLNDQLKHLVGKPARVALPLIKW